LCHDCLVLACGTTAVLPSSCCPERIVLSIVEESIALSFVIFLLILLNIVIIVVGLSIRELSFDKSCIVGDMSIIDVDVIVDLC
jgi:hypothetical protein